MKYVLNSSQMKEIDRFSIESCNIPSMVLMERAAYATVEAILEQKFDGNYVVLTGSGNNGGDGVAIARILHEKNKDVKIYLADEKKERHGELELQIRIARMLDIPIIDKIKYDKNTVFIDAIFGIGLDREINTPYRELIETVNGLENPVISVDVPSGINASTGQVMGVAIKADMTVTFGYLKSGLLLYPGAAYAGNVVVKEIGFAPNAIKTIEKPMYTMDESDILCLPKRKSDGNKGTFGKVLIVAGSRDMGGAAILSCKAAYKSGCGMVRVFTHVSNRTPILQSVPECLVNTYENEIDWTALKSFCDWADSIVVGPGMGTGDIAKSIVGFLMENIEKPMVIDADAINIIASNREMLDKIKENHIFTPHLKEMERLSMVDVANIKKDMIDVCRLFASTNKCVCVLKDSRTVVAKFSQRVYINTKGNSGMAVAGSGDVLTGIIAALSAQGLDSYLASCYGVLLHSLAGDKAACELTEYSMAASDIADNIYKVFKEKR